MPQKRRINNETEFLLFPRVGDINYVTMLVSNTSGELNKGGDGAILSQFFSNYDQNNKKILDESTLNFEITILSYNCGFSYSQE